MAFSIYAIDGNHHDDEFATVHHCIKCGELFHEHDLTERDGDDWCYSCNGEAEMAEEDAAYDAANSDKKGG